MLRLLSILLSPEVQPQEKKKILEESFKIPMTSKIKEEANIMCNLSDSIEQRGYNKGKKEGKSEGKTEMILEMLKDKQPLDLIEKFSYFSRAKIIEIGQENGIAVN